MVTIEKCSEYNVRVMKTPDFKNKVHGYNFSYPVMNTIDICDLFISGGNVIVSMTGKPKSIFAFDMENKKLTITEKGNPKTYIIDDEQELGEVMINYFEEHKAEILEKTRETNLKKSKSKEGNQNAKKDEIPKTTTKSNEEILQEYPADYYNYADKFYGVLERNPDEFCNLDEYINRYDKSPGEYFYWIVRRGWIFRISIETKRTLEQIGYDINDAEKREEHGYGKLEMEARIRENMPMFPKND